MVGAGIGLGFGGTPLLESSLSVVSENCHPGVIWAGKFIIAWPLAFHTGNGIRHLMWDSGRGLDLDMVYKSGWFMLGTTTIIGTGLTFL
jgi:succinate dehydrogenase (ubiquinone) cytochrome b560 subunit